MGSHHDGVRAGVLGGVRDNLVGGARFDGVFAGEFELHRRLAVGGDDLLALLAERLRDGRVDAADAPRDGVRGDFDGEDEVEPGVEGGGEFEGVVDRRVAGVAPVDGHE